MGYTSIVMPEPNAVFGDRYVLIRRIAVGGMGEVWEAHDELLDRGVAVKILKEELRTASTFLDRFRAEARHASQLSHHGIATVYDYGETPELAFLVMELVRGQPLSELMTQQPGLQTVTKLSILCQAAEGLHAAHVAGVVHRDVKPGNLMVRDDGTVKVTDFGIARALTSAPLTEHGQMIGTPAYVSPEQATGGLVTAASDIYSLAVVAYELFADRPPFERDTPLALALAHVNDPPPPLPETVPRGVAELIESALAKDPALRPPSAADFAGQIRREMATLKGIPPGTVASNHDRAPTPNTVSSPSSGRETSRGSTLLVPAAPVAVRRESQRPSNLMVVALAGLLVLMGAAIWAATRPMRAGDARSEVSVASAISESMVATETSLASEPLPSQPVPTEPVPTEPVPTEPVATESVPTQPPPTQPVATEPLPAQPVQTEPLPKPTTTAASDEAAAAGPADESEAVAFVTDYYDRIDAGDYATTWESLSPEFRDDRNLTFESYVSYWENTTLELSDVRFLAGPGVDESRIVFEARYDLGSRVVDETDEITLRRQPDGSLVITKQRTV
ncbi:MAG TPA: protein kinase [Ilumatobacter sp.]|nr:protein kinase [Ilumatobacter sp.]